MELILEKSFELLAYIITICIGVVTSYITRYLKEKGVVAQLEAKKEYVNIVVNAIEQTYKTANGKEKFNAAKNKIIEVLNDKKINITEDELEVLIEAVVKEMNSKIKEELNK